MLTALVASASLSSPGGGLGGVAAALAAGPEGRTLKAFSTLLRGRIRAGEGDIVGQAARQQQRPQ